MMPLLLGCRRAPAPELLVLHGLSQSTLEVGTELQLAGTGFPVHGEGRLIFDGTFHSPGREPRLAQSELPIAADAAGLLRHRLSEEDILRLSGGAQHSTFHGRLRVIFHSRSSFGPELAGGLADVTLDIFGETEKDSALPAEAELFSEFLGLELNDAWEVIQLEDGGEAELAGLQLGDRLKVLDDVHLYHRSDWVPQPRLAMSGIELLRGPEQRLVELHLGRRDFQLLDPSIGWSSLLLLVLTCGALLFFSRPFRGLVWMSGRVVEKGHLHQQAEYRWQVRLLLIAPAVLILSVILARGDAMIPQELSLTLLLGAGISLLFAGEFFATGLGMSRRVGDFRALQGFAGILRLGVLLLPFFFGVVQRVYATGSIDLLSLSSGKNPLGGAFSASPFLFLLSLSALLSLLPQVGARPPLAGIACRPSSAESGARLIADSGTILLVSVWTFLFAGGVGAGQSFSVALLGMGGKLVLILLGLGYGRALLGQLRVAESWSVFGLPNLAIAGTALFFCSTFENSFWYQTGVFDFNWVMPVALIAFLFLGLVVVLRSLSHRGRRLDLWI